MTLTISVIMKQSLKSLKFYRGTNSNYRKLSVLFSKFNFNLLLSDFPKFNLNKNDNIHKNEVQSSCKYYRITYYTKIGLP